MSLQIEIKNLTLYRKDLIKELRLLDNSLNFSNRYPKWQIESFKKSKIFIEEEIVEINNKIKTIHKLEMIELKMQLPFLIGFLFFIASIVFLFFNLLFTAFFLLLLFLMFKINFKTDKLKKKYNLMYKDYFNPLGLSVLDEL